MSNQDERAPRVGRAWQDPDRPLVWVVSGLPRAGTSMVMQMLEAAGLPLLIDSRRGADDDNPRGYYELEAVKGIARDASFLDAAIGRGVKIVAPLLRFLPDSYNYAVLFIERPLGALLDSQRVMLSRQTPPPAPGNDGAADSAFERAFEKSLRQAKTLLEEGPNFAVTYLSHSRTLSMPALSAATVADWLSEFGPALSEGGESRGGTVPREELVRRISAVIDPTLCRHPGRP